MPGINKRTWQVPRHGQLLITVQLDAPTQVGGDLARTAERLIAMLEQLRLPATWATSDPGRSAARAMVRQSAVGHEMALLGDSHWMGPNAGRAHFARELACRVSAARGVGLEISTLLTHSGTIAEHIDLLVKHQFTAIANLETRPSSRQVLPRAVRYGLWEFPVHGRMPVQRAWLGSGAWSTWRQIYRAAQRVGTYHLLIDVPAVCQRGRRVEAALARLMRRVAQLRDRGAIRVETLPQAAAHLSEVPSAAPQRSILRRAA